MQSRPATNLLILIGIAVVVGAAACLNAARNRNAASAPAVAATRASTPADGSRPVTAPGPAAPGARLPRLVDLGANACVACKKLAPILEELRREYADRIDVDFIDVWKNPAAGEPYKIAMIPTQILYDRSGTEVWRHVGFISKEDLIAKFAEVGVRGGPTLAPAGAPAKPASAPERPA